jgi:hypothetical protein
MIPKVHVLVDANIARSATDPANHPTTRRCLVVAKILLDRNSQSGLAMTPCLQEEWRKHATRYMTRWLASMESKGRIKRVRDEVVSDLRTAIKNVNSDGIKAAMMKDIHITSAALYFDFPVVSRDDNQKRYLAMVAAEYELIEKIHWVNPETDQDWEPWLKNGCERNLAYLCTRTHT